MPSAQDVYITPASSVIDIYSGSTKNLYLSGSTHGYIHGASDLKITADDDISLQGQSGGSIITFGTDSTERVRLTEAGNLCIGTTASTEKLRVEGNAIINGHLYVAGVMHHFGDTDTYIGFTGADTIEMQTGGASRLGLNDAGMLLGGANARVTTILDEDNMASNSATALSTQQSIKAYVDANAGGGGGTFGGSLSDNYIPIGTASDTIGNFVLGLTENNSIWIGSDPSSVTNTASQNTALGMNALDSVTTGDYNTAMGRNAGTAVTTGEQNCFFGAQAGADKLPLLAIIISLVIMLEVQELEVIKTMLVWVTMQCPLIKVLIM
jgi:hypothetical protein